MSEVTLSPKYQIVIPKDVRKQLALKSGQKMIVIVKEGIINLIPDRSIVEMRGFLKGMDTTGIREDSVSRKPGSFTPSPKPQITENSEN